MPFPTKLDAWRSHPLLSNGPRHAFPGLRNAVIIFAGYCIVEAAYNKVTGGSAHDHHSSPKNYTWTIESVGAKPELVESDSH